MPNVVFLPGLLGSQLSDYRTLSGLPKLYWIGSGLLNSPGLDALQLAADGSGPGPLAQGKVLTADAALPACYGPFAFFMESLGWKVMSLGYDWRKSLADSAQVVALAALARFKDQPFWLIAHSQGGLVARLAWKVLSDAGRAAQVAGVITIGTPQYGSWEIIRWWGRLPLLYQGIARACGALAGLDVRDALAWVDAVITTWPGAYQIMPCPWAGPLHASNPTLAQQIYNVLFYANANKYVAGAMLTQARQAWLTLLQAVPTGRFTQIVGTGQHTPYLLTGSDDIADPASYLYTDDGDGQVAGVYARLPGVPVVNVDGNHGLLCLLPAVWTAVVQLVGAGA